MKNSGTQSNLRAGSWVEVKSTAEILDSLDHTQGTDGLPFMPEMLRYCGKKFRIYKSAHKTADTIELFTIRRMQNAVHLEELRCDGGAHGGCQARCLLFWKESWLKPAQPPLSEVNGKPFVLNQAVDTVGFDRLCQNTKIPDGESERYRCQATEMLNATTEVRRREMWDPRFYLKDLTSGNVKLFDFIRFGILATINAFLRRWFGRSYPRVNGVAAEKTPTEILNLKPGEWVRVKSKAEIERTLNRHQKNRGLWFDLEMLPYCGKGIYRVERRVDKILNEKTGKMMIFTNPCIILERVPNAEECARREAKAD